MKPFLLAWNPAQTVVMQEELVAFFDQRSEIKNWYAPFLGTILLIADSAQTSSTVANLVHGRFESLQFSVTPLDIQSANGWMPKPYWDLIEHPKSSGRWTDAPSTDNLLKTLAELYGKKEPGHLKSLAELIANPPAPAPETDHEKVIRKLYGEKEEDKPLEALKKLLQDRAKSDK
jgi:hypothetical protein